MNCELDKNTAEVVLYQYQERSRKLSGWCHHQCHSHRWSFIRELTRITTTHEPDTPPRSAMVVWAGNILESPIQAETTMKPRTSIHVDHRSLISAYCPLPLRARTSIGSSCGLFCGTAPAAIVDMDGIHEQYGAVSKVVSFLRDSEHPQTTWGDTLCT